MILVASFVLSIVSIQITVAFVTVVEWIWLGFGVVVLVNFSYVGLSAIRNQVAWSGRNLIKGKQASVVGYIYLIMAFLGLVAMSITVYTYQVNKEFLVSTIQLMIK